MSGYGVTNTTKPQQVDHACRSATHQNHRESAFRCTVARYVQARLTGWTARAHPRWGGRGPPQTLEHHKTEYTISYHAHIHTRTHACKVQCLRFLLGSLSGSLRRLLPRGSPPAFCSALESAPPAAAAAVAAPDADTAGADTTLWGSEATESIMSTFTSVPRRRCKHEPNGVRLSRNMQEAPR